jgi:hypothetical protein
MSYITSLVGSEARVTRVRNESGKTGRIGVATGNQEWSHPNLQTAFSVFLQCWDWAWCLSSALSLFNIPRPDNALWSNWFGYKDKNKTKKPCSCREGLTLFLNKEEILTVVLLSVLQLLLLCFYLFYGCFFLSLYYHSFFSLIVIPNTRYFPSLASFLFSTPPLFYY